MSELEYLERDCEITVLPQPKAPGMAVVPPWTQLRRVNQRYQEEQGYGKRASNTR